MNISDMRSHSHNDFGGGGGKGLDPPSRCKRLLAYAKGVLTGTLSVELCVRGCASAQLRQRKMRGMPAFTVLSCDNIPENGPKAKHLILELASLVDPSGELTKWIADNSAFPMTMVDRITPITTELDKVQLAEQ